MSLKVLVIVNLKGGVGKSITTINLAHNFAQKGKKVIVVDCDPQGDTSRFYGMDGHDNLYRLLTGDIKSNTLELVQPTECDGISVVPASYDVYGLDISMIQYGGSPTVSMEAVKELAQDADDLADVMICDCPPAFNISCCAAIAAATDVIIPTTEDAFSIGGMRGLIEQLNGIQQGMQLDGVLMTMWHNAEVVKAAEDALRGAGFPMLNTHIRDTDKVPESTWAAQPLGVYSKRSSAARDYHALADELAELWGWD